MLRCRPPVCSHPGSVRRDAGDAWPSTLGRRPSLRATRQPPSAGARTTQAPHLPRLPPSWRRRTGRGRRGAAGVGFLWTCRPRQCASPRPAERRDRPPAACRHRRSARQQHPIARRFLSSNALGLPARVRLVVGDAAWAPPTGRRSTPSECRWTSATCGRRAAGQLDRLYARAREPGPRSPAAPARAREGLHSGRGRSAAALRVREPGACWPAPRRTYLAGSSRLLAARRRAILQPRIATGRTVRPGDTLRRSD